MQNRKSVDFDITLEKNPAPHRNVSTNRWGTAYKGKRELAYIKDLSTKMNDKLMDNKNLPIFEETLISVSYTFGYMPAKSWTKKKKKEAFDNIYMSNTPDISNVIKSTDDILMLSKVIDDDQWIVRYDKVEMIYTEKPCIKIHIEEI